MKKTLIIIIAIFLSFVHPTLSEAKKSKHLWDYKTKHFNLYSKKDEIKIGEHYLNAQIKAFKKKGLAVNPKSYEKTRKRIQKIVRRLARVSDMPTLPYEVVIFDKKDVANAFCLPGGKIGIFTGIFDKEKGLIDKGNDSEVAAVLAHEIAHATMRHVTRRLTTYQSFGVLGSIVSMGVGSAAGTNWGNITNQIFTTSGQLYFPSYSRKYEKEADQVGFYYMTKAGFNPKAAIAVWQRAAVKAKKKGKTKTNFFDTHPHSGKRANTLYGYLEDAEKLTGKKY